jgi:glycosyltransferase involved in cell wall biosynthesis
MIASGCIIAQNEEHYIAKAIANMRGYTSEIVVVDGGSTDDTVQIAEAMGCKVFTRPFDFDFADQRNFAAECCTHDWILWCDADEWFTPAFYAKMRDLSGDEPYSSFFVWRVSRFDGSVVGEDYQPRLINRAKTQWNGKVHEGLVYLHGSTPGVPLPKECLMYHEHTMRRQIYNNKLYYNINHGKMERPASNEGAEYHEDRGGWIDVPTNRDA